MDRRTSILLCCYKFVTAVGFRQINKLGNKHNFGQEIIKYFPNRKVARAGRFNMYISARISGFNTICEINCPIKAYNYTLMASVEL